MGMFDELRVVDHALPDEGEALREKTSFQTKDLDCWLHQYRIERGRLLRKGDAGQDIDMNHHGWLCFYTLTPDHRWFAYNAKFTDGQLVEIVAVTQAPVRLVERRASILRLGSAGGREDMSKITAEVSADRQHGPVVTVCVDDVRVSVYLADETGIVTTSDGQHGVQVTGPWHEVRDQLAVMVETRRGK